MPDDIVDRIEDHIGLSQPDAFEQVTDDTPEHGKHIFADPEDGKEKEATVRSHFAGASSEAPASSGVPSAVKQHKLQNAATEDQTETPMANHDIPMTQDVKP